MERLLGVRNRSIRHGSTLQLLATVGHWKWAWDQLLPRVTTGIACRRESPKGPWQKAQECGVVAGSRRHRPPRPAPRPAQQILLRRGDHRGLFPQARPSIEPGRRLEAGTRVCLISMTCGRQATKPESVRPASDSWIISNCPANPNQIGAERHLDSGDALQRRFPLFHGTFPRNPDNAATEALLRSALLSYSPSQA